MEASIFREAVRLQGRAESGCELRDELKTRYRRVSGRKNWNRYLLRSGRRVAYYEAQVRSASGVVGVNSAVERVTPQQWRRGRAEQQARQQDQLKQYRFRHKRATFLRNLEARWAEAAQRTPLLP